MRELPKYVSYEKDRHGNERWYYRRYERRIRLWKPLGTEESTQEIERAAIEIDAMPRRAGKLPRLSTVRMPMVYFFLLGNRRVKIGYSIQVDRRLSEIQGGVPGKAKILYMTPGDMALEKALHRLFAADRVSGEWFVYSPAIRDWIEADKRRREERPGNHLCRTDASIISGNVSLSG